MVDFEASIYDSIHNFIQRPKETLEALSVAIAKVQFVSVAVHQCHLTTSAPRGKLDGWMLN